MKTYTDHIRQWCQWAVAAALIVCIGCSDDFGKMNGNGYETFPSDCLVFTPHLGPGNGTSGTRGTVGKLEIVEEDWSLDMTPDDSSATRGMLTGYLDGNAGVLGFQYDEEDTKTPIAGDGNNLEFTFNGDMLVPSGASIPWKTIDKTYLNVYAYAPYVQKGADSYGMKLDFTTAPPWIDYTVPDVLEDQKDILVARWFSTDHTETDTPESYKNQTIPLEFNHILTAIRFKIGFECKVKSIEIKNVYNSGRYNFLTGKWEYDSSDPSATPSLSTYTIDFLDPEDKPIHFDKDNFLTGDKSTDDDYMILMPQTLPTGAQIVLTYTKETPAVTAGNEDTGSTGNTGNTGEDTEYTITADIGGKVWDPGKLITYTFYENSAPEMIYFDLAAGNVTIDASSSSYKGYVYKENDNGELTITTVSGEHKNGNHYYVYQSTENNRTDIWNGEECTPPQYDRVVGPDGRLWSDFITNNTDVDAVIEAWDKNHNDLVTAVKRTGTNNRIEILGGVTCNLTIDNIYSTYQDSSNPAARTHAGITFKPIKYNAKTQDAKVTVNMFGDNRIGAVHYFNRYDNGNEIIFEGTGSLTVADVDGETKKGNPSDSDPIGIKEGVGYYSNHWSSAIGGNDSSEEESYGIVINSGIIFAGTTKAENCTAIGGGGNVYGKVTINGGTVTAVATTTGTAIGGGIGFNSQGGEGFVTINGGKVYAYNHDNKWLIPSSAIGGAGSRASKGNKGTVNINGGYVYAESALGTAIGGGSSYLKEGGDAIISITGGEVIAKTKSEESASIGGGTAYTQRGKVQGYNGGNAIITISNNPIIRTGSIGGGGTGDTNGKIGNAKIQIYGGDIQAQFILQAGSKEPSSFEMIGGTIRNSNTADPDYLHVQEDGGAVWLQNGTVTITGGTIENCKAKRGGAIYIAGESGSNAVFSMSGGTIRNNEAVRENYSGTHGDTDTDDSVNDFEGSGGAIYLIDGEVKLTGGTIAGNLSAGGHGGGVFIRRGNLTVDGATIRGNATEVRRTDSKADPNTGTYAGGNGGGVYVYSKKADVDVNIISGEITGNTADRRGGGICVIQEKNEEQHSAKITIGTENGTNEGMTISGNRSMLQGGGLYARGSEAHITINSGTIQGNEVSQYVHNKNVANDQGSVTLNGGDVTHNVVTFNANYGANPETSAQRIVTETNSRLKAPAFSRTGYKLIGWNSKPSGSGEWYSDGMIMNITQDITLYAQWEFGGN